MATLLVIVFDSDSFCMVTVACGCNISLGHFFGVSLSISRTTIFPSALREKITLGNCGGAHDYFSSLF